MKYFRENKGITLIILITTIIILLILTGITLTITLGKNGIIQKTMLAKNKVEEEIEENYLDDIKRKTYDIIEGNDYELVPEGKRYSIQKGKEKTYYTTFKEAYEASVDKGGQNGGGTIVLEKDATEELVEDLEINKTITIDLKLNTMKINKRIDIIGGTLTLTGQDYGEKIGTMQRDEDNPMIGLYNDANINITGSPLLKSASHTILTNGERWTNAAILQVQNIHIQGL